MGNNMTDKKGMITIDGVEYKMSELSKECQAEVQSLQFTELMIQRLTAEIAVATTAGNAYRKAISDSLPKQSAQH
tara:strand:- start:123 stop:347 length:225 start_codon:yes stop_codon:yes gene_type:complete